MAKRLTDSVCETCGSDKVEQRMWVRINTKGVREACGTGDIEDNWCPACEDNPVIVTRQQYDDANQPD